MARTEEHLKEVYLTREKSDFKEELGPLDGTEVAHYVARYAHETDEGCRVEVNLAGVDWMRAVAEKLRRGFTLTIDYGHLAGAGNFALRYPKVFVFFVTNTGIIWPGITRLDRPVDYATYSNFFSSFCCKSTIRKSLNWCVFKIRIAIPCHVIRKRNAQRFSDKMSISVTISSIFV